MWHEARKREKVTQKLFNDHKRRADKRREENRLDPSTFLQVNGLKSKLHIDSSIYRQAAKSLVVWQGDKNVTIDRFDVRATITSIPKDDGDIDGKWTRKGSAGGKREKSLTIEESSLSEATKKYLNYERYRLLMQNDLNKVPEEKRLSLVARSDSFSGAKMKKLQNNWFGTSGETIATYQSSNRVNSHSTSSSQSLSGRQKASGVAISYSYNQVPPPQQSSTKNLNDSSSIGDPASRQTINAQAIIDLDDYEDCKFNLDFVDKSSLGAKKITEVTTRYGLDCDEFNLLVDNDQREPDESIRSLTSADLIKELEKLKQRKLKLQEKLELERQQSNVYGPALPPEMVTKSDQKTTVSPPRHSSSPSSANSSPIRQRSPSGAGIPLRSSEIGEQDEGSPRNYKELTCSIADAESKSTNSIGVDKQVELPDVHKSKMPTVPEHKTDGCSKSSPVHQADLKSIPNIQNDIRPGERRASTPLAYKRYERSSRSISQERRRKSRKSHDYPRSHRRKRDSRSISRSSGSWTSSSDSSSMSSIDSDRRLDMRPRSPSSHQPSKRRYNSSKNTNTLHRSRDRASSRRSPRSRKGRERRV